MDINLDKEEQELMVFYESEQWVSIATPENLAKYKQLAKNTLSQRSLVSVELSKTDLSVIQPLEN